MAGLHHSCKNESRIELHQYCPKGDHSWLKWQWDQATGKQEYSDKNCLPKCFLEILKPIHEPRMICCSAVVMGIHRIQMRALTAYCGPKVPSIASMAQKVFKQHFLQLFYSGTRALKLHYKFCFAWTLPRVPTPKQTSYLCSAATIYHVICNPVLSSAALPRRKVSAI